MSPYVIAVILAWVAGFVDVVGYLTLSNVFSAHMSGNTVAAASHLGTGEWPQIFRRAFPIPMFVTGVFIGALIGRTMQRSGCRHRFAPLFLLETILLGVFVTLTGSKTSGANSLMPAYPLIALLAVAMGLQNATLRCARGVAVRTTFISGMLVNMGEQAAGYAFQLFALRPESASQQRRRRQQGKRALKYGLLWCGMFAGGASGAWLQTFWGTYALLFPLAGLLAISVQDYIWPISES